MALDPVLLLKELVRIDTTNPPGGELRLVRTLERLFAREDALAILRDGVWDDFTHNRAIQKLRESWRVSDADKALALSLKRRKGKS